MRTIANLREKITQLETKSTASFAEISQRYQTYLDQLENAVATQLTQAVHHIATQLYPEVFLSLKFNQRQKFLTRLQRTTKSFQPKLKAILATKGIHLTPILPDHPEPQAENTDAVSPEHPEIDHPEIDHPEVEEKSPAKIAESTPEDADASLAEISETMRLPAEVGKLVSQLLEEADSPADLQEIKANLLLSLEELLPKKVTTFTVNNPEDLRQWCHIVEQGIQFMLDTLSQDCNAALQAIGVINPKLPTKILEMALRAEENGINIGRSGIPNILNLVVEARQERPTTEGEEENTVSEDDDEESDQSQVMKIVAVHLRLSEIEFADPQLNHSRQQLKQLAEQMDKLCTHYRSLKQSLLRSEAEAAWRASWIESDS